LNAADQSEHQGARQEYRAEFSERFWQEFRAKKPIRLKTAIARPATRSWLDRCRSLLAVVIHNPEIIPSIEDDLADLDLKSPLTELRDAILRWAEDVSSLDSRELMSHLRSIGFDAALRQIPTLNAALRTGGARLSREEAQISWEQWRRVAVCERLKFELHDAVLTFERDPSQENQNKIIALRSELHRLESGGPQDADVW